MKVFMFPGQGSQARGMGKGLFAAFPDHLAKADDILGYSVEDLCLHDPQRRLSDTRYTQPALYVVNALSFLQRRQEGEVADALIGHSLGEYNALFAAGALSFEAGLRLVQRRAELMGAAHNGGMAAILGVDAAAVQAVLDRDAFADLDIANLNGPLQTVISGAADSIVRAQAPFERSGATYIPLNVSGAFHSRLMAPAAELFRRDLQAMTFSPLQTPVLANVTARPYEDGEVAQILAAQLTSPVRWMDSIRHLMGLGAVELLEVGPGRVLTGMAGHIVRGFTPAPDAPHVAPPSAPQAAASTARLGSARFRQDYGLDQAYLAEGLGRGSANAIGRLGRAGLLGVIASDDGPAALAEELAAIQALSPPPGAYGVAVRPGPELRSLLDVVERAGARLIVACGFDAPCEDLVRYRLRALARPASSSVRLIAKVGRLESARAFMQPPPDAIVDGLLARGEVDDKTAALAAPMPMADDVIACASAWPGEEAPLTVLAPAMKRLACEMVARHGYSRWIHVGAAGGMGAGEAVAAAFVLGADFVVTGSINQCTAEAATSPQAKDLMQAMGVQDVAYVPDAEGFEAGAKICVMARGVFFPARANRLYDLWRRHAAWEDVEPQVRQRVESQYFQQTFEAVCTHLDGVDGLCALPPKARMAAVFKWYLNSGRTWATAGERRRLADFQVRAGWEMGAYNQWARHLGLNDWSDRHIDEVGLRLMDAASEIMT